MTRIPGISFGRSEAIGLHRLVSVQPPEMSAPRYNARSGRVRVAGSNPGDIWGGENLQGTMMRYGLTLTSFLERAGKLFPGVEVISSLPDNSVRRSSYSDLYRRARALGPSQQRVGDRAGGGDDTLMRLADAAKAAAVGTAAVRGAAHT